MMERSSQDGPAAEAAAGDGASSGRGIDSDGGVAAGEEIQAAGGGATTDQGGADGPLAVLRREFDELHDRHLRLAAEFNNYRRRNEHERLETWSRAQADLLGRFLDVLDDLQRVAQLDTTNATVPNILEGIDLVERKFVRMLADAGAEVIDPAEEAFDPERMEAVMRVPTDEADLDDCVAQVFQKGYALKGVLVRPARVTVYKHG